MCEDIQEMPQSQNTTFSRYQKKTSWVSNIEKKQQQNKKKKKKKKKKNATYVFNHRRTSNSTATEVLPWKDP